MENLMSSKAMPVDSLRAWSSIPRQIRKAIVGLSAADLSRHSGLESWSVQEYVHHLIEANVIAATIIIAALEKPSFVPEELHDNPIIARNACSSASLWQLHRCTA
jgi:hypothetical protein